MPYYKYDFDDEEIDDDEELDEDHDEIEEEEDDASWEEADYETASATFDFATADHHMKTVREALLAEGIAILHCSYDGGYDEGFASLESAQQGQTVLTPALLAEALKDTPVADTQSQMSWLARYSGLVDNDFGSLPSSQRIGETMDTFARKLAWKLLGNSYGTGEYRMRGRFRADLVSGELMDLQDEA